MGEFKYLMYITCKETGENIHEIYGDSKEDMLAEFEDEYGEQYCCYEIMENE